MAGTTTQTTHDEPIIFGVSSADIAHGADISVIFSPGKAVFNDAGHGVNFAKYLFRAGGEHPNDLTHHNAAWNSDDMAAEGFSADHRTEEGAALLERYKKVFAANWKGLTNGLVYFMVEGDKVAGVEPVLSNAEMWGVLDYMVTDVFDVPVGEASVLYVSHNDQGHKAEGTDAVNPQHIHYVTRNGLPSLYDLAVAAVSS